MTDPRVEALADILVHYSLDLHPGDELAIVTTPLAAPHVLAVYREALKAGAHVVFDVDIAGAQRVFYEHASDEQLSRPSVLGRLRERRPR